jgi:hypothetical protein
MKIFALVFAVGAFAAAALVPPATAAQSNGCIGVALHAHSTSPQSPGAAWNILNCG